LSVGAAEGREAARERGHPAQAEAQQEARQIRGGGIQADAALPALLSEVGPGPQEQQGGDILLLRRAWR
ncbi:UNVERIFIED_CONTAM: hypothetical protein GTU68_027671, partial [Idotea baltica]|nr:hypothetical protein [Idotea baltica]